ncbi:MAG: Uma2 family endonuclease [Gammaproteobacteria bacterium]|nr:Uma2 family endonuclease [Gammaproteobacteria bacterium]
MSTPIETEEATMGSLNHGYVQINLGAEIRALKKYTVIAGLSLDIDGDEHRPDLSVYPKRKIDFSKDQIKMTELPLLAIEVLSPKQGYQDIMDKFATYLKAGIKSCWLVLPMSRAITVFNSLEDAKTFSKDEIIDDTADIRLPLKEIFI